MRKSHLGFKLVDYYIINQLIPTQVFSLFICTVLSELVGISFEQIKFVATQGLPIGIAVQVHYLKLPAYICQALPFALLMATTIVYSNLSARSEIIALQSYGISPYRLIAPTIAIALVSSVLLFMLQEVVVPAANYQAALVLERQWQIDRTQLAKYNKREIIYQKFSADRAQPSLEFLFFASRFDGEQMQEITLLKYQNRYLQEIITSQTAQWNEQEQFWQLFDAHRNVLNINGSSAQNQDFKELSVELTKDILDYANHHRDHREMSLWELYRRLDIINHTHNSEEIRQLKISIQSRFALPFSCLVFAFLGSILGITTEATTKSNSLGLAAILVIVYYSAQFMAIALTTTEVLPVFWGVWLPNLLCLSWGCYLQKTMIGVSNISILTAQR
jgi:lipopolysaccharide export system permease protein